MATLLIHPEDLDSERVVYAITEDTLTSIVEECSRMYGGRFDPAQAKHFVAMLTQDNTESIPLNE